MPNFLHRLMSWTIREFKVTNAYPPLKGRHVRLLLGVDSEQKHLACGLVDTIGQCGF